MVIPRNTPQRKLWLTSGRQMFCEPRDSRWSALNAFSVRLEVSAMSLRTFASSNVGGQASVRLPLATLSLKLSPDNHWSPHYHPIILTPVLFSPRRPGGPLPTLPFSRDFPIDGVWRQSALLLSSLIRCCFKHRLFETFRKLFKSVTQSPRINVINTVSQHLEVYPSGARREYTLLGLQGSQKTYRGSGLKKSRPTTLLETFFRMIVETRNLEA